MKHFSWTHWWNCVHTVHGKNTSKISKEASPTAKAEDLLFPLIYHISIRLMQSISFILKAPVLSKLSTPSCLPRTERKKKSFIFMHFPGFWTKSFPWLLFKFQVIQTNLWTGSIDSLNWLDSASFTLSKKNIHVFSRPGKHNSKITWHYF